MVAGDCRRVPLACGRLCEGRHSRARTTSAALHRRHPKAASDPSSEGKATPVQIDLKGVRTVDELVSRVMEATDTAAADCFRQGETDLLCQPDADIDLIANSVERCRSY